jgi:hypothetical protein
MENFIQQKKEDHYSFVDKFLFSLASFMILFLHVFILSWSIICDFTKSPASLAAANVAVLMAAVALFKTP